MPDLDELRARFRDLGRTSSRRAPLYARLAAGVADDPEVAALLLAAPAEQHNPTLLLNAVHELVLRGDAPALAAWYPNLAATPASGDPYPAFREVAMAWASTLRDLVAVRRTQTNEIGRYAVLLPAFGLLAAEHGPLAHLDVGTSAGLNLLLPRYHYRYEPGGEVGAPSPVELVCSARGPVPVPAHMPPVVAGVGLDSQPVDVTDDDAVRWLEACVWPDQADRFERLRSAIALARERPPDVRRGDVVEDLAGALAGLADAAAGSGHPGAHPVVTTTWVLNYLPVEGQRAFVAELDRLAAGGDLSWVAAESPADAPGLELPAAAGQEHLTALVLTTWRGGERSVTHLGVSHPHGYWLHWGAATDGASPPPS